MSEPQGERFGEYIRTELLGKGGFGEVWRAWDTKLSRWIALKILHQQDPDQQKRLVREAQTAASLSHPNIAAIYQVGDVDSRSFIALQLVDGRTLETVPRHDPRELARILRDASLAVAHAHERGIIHRDLKPANIMVARDGRVFVMDFGIARDINVRSSLSVSGIVMGTPAYMSPEQTRGERVDARSDVWSLGVTLYEVLAGHPPFRATNVMSLLDEIARDEPAPLPGDLGTIALACLEKDPDRRYASAAALALDLTRWLNGEPIAASAPSLVHRARKWIARRAVLVAISAAVLIAVVAGFFGKRWLDERKQRERDAVAARDREEGLKELGALWTRIVLARRDLHKASNDPRRVYGEISDAVGAVSSYIARRPDHPQGYYVRARGLLYIEELDAAEGDLRHAVALNPAFAPGEILLGHVLLQRVARAVFAPAAREARVQGQVQPLLKEARRLLDRRADPESDRASLLRWGLPNTREDDEARIVGEALWQYYGLDRQAEALALLESAHAKDPSPAYAGWLGQWNGDLALLTWAIQAMPLSARAYFDRGTVRTAGGDTPGALADYDEATRIQPNFALAYYNGAVLMSAEGDRFIGAGDVNRALAASESAIARYSKALAADPGFADAVNNRGLTRRQRAGLLVALDRDDAALVEFDAAIGDFDASCKLAPTYVEAWINRGQVRVAKGLLVSAGGRREAALAEWRSAIEDCDAALRIDATNPHALACRAAAHIVRGEVLADILHRPAEARAEWDAAIADCNSSLALQPGDPEALTNRGSAHEWKGDVRGAILDYEEALRGLPADSPMRSRVERFLSDARKKPRKE